MTMNMAQFRFFLHSSILFPVSETAFLTQSGTGPESEGELPVWENPNLEHPTTENNAAVFIKSFLFIR